MISMTPAMTSVQPNAQYNVAAADSLPVRIAAHQRRKMFARFLADTLPNATLSRFEDTGHAINLEEPAEFNRRLADFIASVT